MTATSSARWRSSGLLDEARIPYAIVGAMALNEYGYQRVTVDVDILLTREGLEAFPAVARDRGYVEKFQWEGELGWRGVAWRQRPLYPEALVMRSSRRCPPERRSRR